MNTKASIEITSIFNHIKANNLKYCWICLRTEEERRLVNPVNLPKCANIMNLSIPESLKLLAICYVCESESTRAYSFFQAIKFAEFINTWFEKVASKLKYKKDTATFLDIHFSKRGDVASVDWCRRLRGRCDFVQTEVLAVGDEPIDSITINEAPTRPPRSSDHDSIVILDDDEELVAKPPPPLTKAPLPPPHISTTPPPISIAPPLALMSQGITVKASNGGRIPLPAQATPPYPVLRPTLAIIAKTLNVVPQPISIPMSSIESPRVLNRTSTTVGNQPKIIPVSNTLLLQNDNVALPQSNENLDFIFQKFVLGSDGNFHAIPTQSEVLNVSQVQEVVSETVPEIDSDKDTFEFESDFKERAGILEESTVSVPEGFKGRGVEIPPVKVTESPSDSSVEKRPVMSDRIDWEDKIPMDLISFVDASDPIINEIQQSSGPKKKKKKENDIIDLC